VRHRTDVVVDNELLDLALTAVHPVDPAPPLIVEIEHSALPLQAQPIDWWQRRPGATPPPDLPVLEWVQDGSVLDVGCCTGRHLELLARRGIRGSGIDPSPAAIRLATAAGIPCEVADPETCPPPAKVDTVLLMGGNGGLARELSLLAGVLTRMASWLKPGGAILFTSVDWRLLPALDDGTGRASRAYPGRAADAVPPRRPDRIVVPVAVRRPGRARRRVRRGGTADRGTAAARGQPALRGAAGQWNTGMKTGHARGEKG